MTTTYLEAIHDAIDEEMATDERVIVFGEDIGAYGGAFKVTEGLLDKYGTQRIIETPIAEAAVVGAAAGAAMYGMRPIAELQFIDFISCAGFDQLVTVAAKSRYRNGVPCPMVLRGPSGGGGRGGPFHSACPEMWAVTTPGIKVVFPSTAYDAKGLMKAAIRDPDPVLYLEHKFLYRRVQDELPTEEFVVELGKAALRRDGTDATIITYGAMTHVVLEAVETLSAEGHNIRVLDLRSLVPLDEEAIIQATKETNRILIVHEHAGRGGLAGEITSIINENAFDYLDAPILRVTAPNTPVPYAPPLEEAYLPRPNDVLCKARELLEY